MRQLVAIIAVVAEQAWRSLATLFPTMHRDPRMHHRPSVHAHCEQRRANKRPLGYGSSLTFLVSVLNHDKINPTRRSTTYLQPPVPRGLIDHTNTSAYEPPLNHRTKQRGRPLEIRIWNAVRHDWLTRIEEVSPDIDFPVGACDLPDSICRRGGRLRYEERERLSMDGHGYFYREVGYVPVSYPVVRRQQERRVKALKREGLAHLADDAIGPKGKSFIALEGFSDRPANLFSIRQRVAAFTDVGLAVAKDVPRHAYAFTTILAGVVDDFRTMNPLQVRTLMDDSRLLVATGLRQCGADVAYVLGFWEVAEHTFPNPHPPINDYLEAWYLGRGRGQRLRRTQIVLHLHLSVLAYDESAWIPVDVLKTFLEASSTLPNQVLVKSWRRFDLIDNLRRTTAYAAKPPHQASSRLIVQDALFRDMIVPSEQWPEGWLQLHPNRNLSTALRPNALRRIKEIEKFTLFGAGGPFRENAHWWG
jgi:hypothetical protein